MSKPKDAYTGTVFDKINNNPTGEIYVLGKRLKFYLGPNGKINKESLINYLLKELFVQSPISIAFLNCKYLDNYRYNKSAKNLEKLDFVTQQFFFTTWRNFHEDLVKYISRRKDNDPTSLDWNLGGLK